MFCIVIGYKNTCPRDGILVVGDEIIEAAMGMRARLFEFHPYRKLMMEYFRQGAAWTAAPRPTMHDDLYRKVGANQIWFSIIF
jgi:glycine amidinotransferase